jgi:hypothetical protein
VDGPLPVQDQNSDGMMNPPSLYDPSSVGTSSHHPQSLGLSAFSHQQELAALQQQLQEMYCMPPGPDHQEKVIAFTFYLLIVFTMKLFNMGIRLVYKERILLLFLEKYITFNFKAENRKMKLRFTVKLFKTETAHWKIDVDPRIQNKM